MITPSIEAAGVIHSPMTGRRHFMVHRNDLVHPRLWYNDAVVFPQPLIVEVAGVVQQLGVRLEVVLSDQGIVQVVLPPAVWRLGDNWRCQTRLEIDGLMCPNVHLT